jgi:hypothetical protein
VEPALRRGHHGGSEHALRTELEDTGNGVTKLTLTHELDGAPVTAALIGGSMPARAT